MRIFIIEDDHFSMYLTESFLTLENATWEVQTFLSAMEALEFLESGGTEALPEIMLLDLNMPVMDGWAFVEALQLKYIELPKRCCLYILTSSIDPSDINRANEYPIITGFLQKPLSVNDIEIMVQHCTLSQETINLN